MPRDGQARVAVELVVVVPCHQRRVAGDQVRVGVLLVLARPVQVVEEAEGALPALVEPGDHAGLIPSPG